MAEPADQLSFEVTPGRWVDPRSVRSVDDLGNGNHRAMIKGPEGWESFVINGHIAAQLRAAMERARPLSWIGKILKMLRGL